MCQLVYHKRVVDYAEITLGWTLGGCHKTAALGDIPQNPPEVSVFSKLCQSFQALVLKLAVGLNLLLVELS